MNSRKLASFIALARTLHFAKAAAEVNLTQAGLSQHIRSLEEEWGLKLFERDKRHVALTPQGKLLLSDVEQTVERIANLQRKIRAIAVGFLGGLNIGYVGTSVLQPGIVTAVRTFRSLFPDVRLDLTEQNVNQQFSMLQSGELDIGIVRGPLPDNRSVLRKEIQRSALQVVVPVTHKLAENGKISLTALTEETVLIQDDPDGMGLGSTVLNMFAQAGITPARIVRTRDVSTAIDLTALGMGVTLVPALRDGRQRNDAISLPLIDTHSTTSLFLCYKAGTRNPHTLHFIEHITETFFQGVSTNR